MDDEVNDHALYVRDDNGAQLSFDGEMERWQISENLFGNETMSFEIWNEYNATDPCPSDGN